MKLRMTITSALAVGALTFILAPAAQAQVLSTAQRHCFEDLAKLAGKFVKKKLSTIQKCNDKNLKEPGDCTPGELSADLAEVVASFTQKLDDSDCGVLVASQFAGMGFPGKCVDPNPLDEFTYTDLKNCLLDSHENAVDTLIPLEYGTTTGPLDSATLNCQKAISKNGGKFLNAKLQAVQKCRNNINKNTITGILPKNCATAHPDTVEKITKAESKARAGILKKCTSNSLVAALDVCDPPADTEPDVENCIIQTHGDAADDVAATASDLIDFEYATPPVCGDGLKNTLDEECDGADAAACPGQCGAANSQFPCLCLTKPRLRIVEHANADNDSGWTGFTHDGTLVEGSSILVDLYDCVTCIGGANDGGSCKDNSACPGGTCDTLCIAGPSCSGAPHSPCSNDAQCAFFAQGTCRKERTASGPHCYTDIQTVCDTNAQCPGVGNFCLKQVHGSPLPVSGGGVAVCVQHIFLEDVTGTVDLATGSSAINYAERGITYIDTGSSQDQPCPVCGGWCNDTGRRNCATASDCNLCTGGANDGQPCANDSECQGGTCPDVTCVTAPICNRGPNANKECRPDSPFGGAHAIFGITSVDCPPTGTLVGNLDIPFHPRTTGNSTLLPTQQCDAPGFGNMTCKNGTSNGRPCTTASECPGGTCSHQCFCPPGGVLKQPPNACEAACLGGPNDTAACVDDSECPGGAFCHPADCRVNPLDPNGPHEGACAAGPLYNTCSLHTFRQCDNDADCRPPNCVFCETSETCQLGFRPCFENTGIIRDGIIVDPYDTLTTVSTFCIPQASQSSVNQVSGFPGPGAERWPESRFLTGY